MRFYSVVSAALLAMSLTAGPVSAAAGDDFEAAYKAADEARKKAASVGGEWRDIGKFLKKSKEIQAKDPEKAMKLVAKAKFQAEMGYKQAVDQQGKDLTPAYLK